MLVTNYHKKYAKIFLRKGMIVLYLKQMDKHCKALKKCHANGKGAEGNHYWQLHSLIFKVF